RAKRLAQLRQAYESGILDEETYQATVAALQAQSGARQATVSGPGALAFEGGTAVGEGGIAVGRDVHGNVYVGSPPQDVTEALRIYRRVLVSTCRHLPLRGVDVGASDPTGGQQRLDLAQVYVDLDTKSHVPLTDEGEKQRGQRTPAGERETRPLGVLEATIGNRHLVILGDPGSGVRPASCWYECLPQAVTVAGL
ncbi:MAG: hypothetical protein KAW49_04185, partial [Anaerolineae bacterium]|nr:hypothetical protein [Anaerolineae bacterium]